MEKAIDIFAGTEVRICEYLPKCEEAEISYNRNFFQRLFRGKLHDLKFTEHDAIWFASNHMGMNAMPFLLMSQATYDKIKDALRFYEELSDPAQNQQSPKY